MRVTESNKRTGILPIVILCILFVVACLVQAFDDRIDSREIRLFATLAAHFLFIGIFAYWTVSLISRVSVREIRIGLTSTIALMGLLLFLRLLKYEIFFGETATRYLWYSYYIPRCLAPVVLLLTVLGTARKDGRPLPKPWYLLFVPAAALILLVFTNDLHEFVFSFPKGLAFANKIYKWGPGYYLALAWMAGLFLAVGILLYFKCRISHCRKKAWIPLVLFFTCGALCILREVFDPSFLRAPESLTFSVVIVCESLLRIGFIPTNVEHARFFDLANISASIADSSLQMVLRSRSAPAITPAQATAAAENGKILLHDDLVLRAQAIRGGEVFWTEDLSVIHRINEKLAEANETLSEEGDLIAAENKLKEQRSKIEEQNKLYEGIFTLFRPHLQKMQMVFSQADTPEEKDRALRTAVVYGVYLKRRSNLAMLAKDGGARFSELVYSVRESADALSFYGAVSSVVSEGDGVYPIEKISFLYEFFEDCVERALAGLSACFVRLTATGGDLACRVALDNPATRFPSDWRREDCARLGAAVTQDSGDETLYLTLTLRGEEVRA